DLAAVLDATGVADESAHEIAETPRLCRPAIFDLRQQVTMVGRPRAPVLGFVAPGRDLDSQCTTHRHLRGPSGGQCRGGSRSSCMLCAGAKSPPLRPLLLASC